MDEASNHDEQQHQSKREPRLTDPARDSLFGPGGFLADINLCIFAAIFCSFLACFSGVAHVADLFVQFRVQMAAALIIMVVFLAATYKVKPSPRLLAAVVVALILNVVSVAATTMSFSAAGPLPPGAVEKSAPGLSLLQYNVHSSNKKYDQLIEYAGRVKPDILCLEEVTPAWVAGLTPLRKNYPYEVTRARDDNFGIAIFSRYPLKDAAILSLGKAGLPSAFARVELRGKVYSIVATHPLPPVTGESYNLRNDQYKALADFAKKDTGAGFILAGDFNCVPWSAHFMSLLSASSLKDSRAGFGLGESWPVNCFVLRIPIDNVLVAKNIRVRVRRVEPDLGSDHLPVYVELR
ncbi:MAG: endonuclease/exonuclease/phosphatase family protein [Cyanobacteria bacterium SZAS TMP-1]|nr:endonuclease/exonuclease/phosphatase family protein [Cyanobacteria bacterium SZAS TMP-1]